jgi:hypothetical protein
MTSSTSGASQNTSRRPFTATSLPGITRSGRLTAFIRNNTSDKTKGLYIRQDQGSIYWPEDHILVLPPAVDKYIFTPDAVLFLPVFFPVFFTNLTQLTSIFPSFLPLSSFFVQIFSIFSYFSFPWIRQLL